MEHFDTTNPVEGDASPSGEVHEEDASAGSARTENAIEPTLDASTDPGQDEFGNRLEDEEESDEERLEEIERNGRRATIPAWLKPELMMQADYTRKTQELAEARRAFEAEREAVQQLSGAELSVVANLNSIDRQIDQFANVDWNAWNDSDPVAAQRAFGRFQILKDARRETLGYLDSLRQERTSITQQDSAKRFEECAVELARDLKDWSPELSAKLLDFGQRHYGFSRDDLDGIDDPRVIKALYAAYQWEEHQGRQRRAERHAAAQAVRPAARVGGAAPKSGLDDRLSAEEWLRRRNSQLRKRA